MKRSFLTGAAAAAAFLLLASAGCELRAGPGAGARTDGPDPIPTVSEGLPVLSPAAPEPIAASPAPALVPPTEPPREAEAPALTAVPEPASAVQHYTREEVVMVAKLLYRECGGVASDTEKACVVWTVCNRVDSGAFGGETVAEVVTAQNQFAYDVCAPIEQNLYALADDVLSRWSAERNGLLAVGRVLPREYVFFSGDGAHNYFRTAYRGGSVWDYSLASPYGS